VLDKHCAHISTRRAPSWQRCQTGLNSPSRLFGKIRVASADELKARIELYVKEVNETPGGCFEVQTGSVVPGLVIDLLFANLFHVLLATAELHRL
jgi:hypothetical protein